MTEPVRVWVGMATDDPRDQEIDLNGSWWAAVAPDGGNPWSWRLYDRWLYDNARVVASGSATTEEEAKTAALAAYAADHSEHPDCTCSQDETGHECPIHGETL